MERYGGTIHSSWFDRPLSVAGRIIVCNDKLLEEKLVMIDRDLMMIPSLAIHMNPMTNKGAEYNLQNEMLPIFTQKLSVPDETTETRTLLQLIAEHADVNPSDILGSDLFLYNRMPSIYWGADREYIASARLDDLECCFTTFLGFLEAIESITQQKIVNIHAVFDNEEVGSGTAQGADSTFLAEIMERISLACGCNREEYMAQLASGFMLSADNAHAAHPNYPEKADPVNRPVMNKGIVIKHNASQKYTTDGFSNAMIVKLCQNNHIPYQFFTNRSDMTGGSTLGNISQAHVSMKTADIGLAQLAMHSSYESAGADDPEFLKHLARVFYSEPL